MSSRLLVQIRAALLFVACCATSHASDVARTGGPFVPTPQVVVDAMLELTRVSANDFVVDLGSGDGRIVLTAAQRYSARGVGFDIDKELVDQSNAEAKTRGLADRVSFREQDVLEARVSDATVLTLYLLPGMMQTLQAKLARELKPGTRIVSHDFPFGDWKADREVSVDVPEKYGSPGQWKSTLFYWVVPAPVGGAWSLTVPGLAPQPLPITLNQHYQKIEGAAMMSGRRFALSGGRVEADRVSFRLPLPGGTYDFHGSVQGERMEGEAAQNGRTIHWTATRESASARFQGSPAAAVTSSGLAFSR